MNATGRVSVELDGEDSFTVVRQENGAYVFTRTADGAIWTLPANSPMSTQCANLFASMEQWGKSVATLMSVVAGVGPKDDQPMPMNA